MRDDFVVFILSYKRADRMYTIKSLLESGYSGKYYIILGNDDPTIEEYKNKYGKDNILVFDKEEYANKVDTCDNFNKRKVILYARNYCFDIAKELGYNYFLQLDDDYTSFEYRYDEDNKFKVLKVKEFDTLVDIMIEFLDCSNATTIAFGQGGDFIGGKDSSLAKAKIKRKAMNSFFCSTKREFRFFGSINEDVNAYCKFGSMGKLFMTLRNISIVQKQTQSNSGGMTDEYIDGGTYVKAFYTVMTNPSFVKIFGMDTTHTRIHHRVDWDKAVPKIISDKYRKYKPKNNLVIIGDYCDDLFDINLLHNSVIYCNNKTWIEKLKKINLNTFPITKKILESDFKFDCISTTKESQEQIKPYKDNIQSMITYDFRVDPPKLWKRIKN